MNATGQNIVTPEICLATCVENIQKLKVSSYSIMLVNGTPMDRVSILNLVYALGRANWDILTVRLSQDITEKELEFSVHLMRNLAQEITMKENLTVEMSSLVTEYLHPFELSEKTRKSGIAWKFSFGKEEKFFRREKYPEEIRRDYIYCFECIQELQWLPILIIDSIERLSKSSERFLIDFIEKYGERSVTVLGGPSESSLAGFVRNQGIGKHLPVAFIIQNGGDYLDSETNGERPQVIPDDVFELGSFIVNAFATESRKFNYLKLDVWDQFGLSDFDDSDKSFDLCILGHLRMREDYPRLIRTDYDCAVIIKVLDGPITDMLTLSTPTEAAYRVLIDGIPTTRGIRFEPWESFIFLAASGVSKFILDEYEHLPYRNLFILLPDATFQNLSPHKWMNHILNNISCRWSELMGRKGKQNH